MTADAEATHLHEARLSRNVVVVGAGLGLIGLGSLGLLAIVSRSLPPEGFARVGVWFALVNLLAHGLYAPLDTAISRAMLGAGDLTPRMRRQAASYASVVFVAVLLLGLALASVVVPRLMGGSWLLLGVTAIYLLLLALQSIQRGVAVGHDRFWVLFWQFGTDGALRLLLPGLVALLGAATPVWFAVAVCGSAATGLVAGQIALTRPGTPREDAGRPLEVSTGLDLAGLGALIVAAVGAQLVANGAGPVLGLLDRDGPEVIAGVVGALALTRMPLLFASAVQAPLLPPMVRSVRSGDTAGLWRLLRRVIAVFGVVCAVSLGAGWLLGALVLRVYLGDDYGVSPLAMALLVSAGVALLAVVAVQAAIVAVGSSAVLVVSWVLGIVVFLTIMVVPGSGLVIAPLAIATATVVTLAAMLVGLRLATARQLGASPTEGRLAG